MIDPKWKPYYRQLMELRDEVMTQENELAANAREIQPNYLQREAGDVADQDLQRDLNLGQLSAEQQLLNEIEAALDRIESGAYGICELTGKPIPPDRLKAVPWTRFTVEAEREIERQGGNPRVAMAPPQSLRSQFNQPSEGREPAEDVGKGSGEPSDDGTSSGA